MTSYFQIPPTFLLERFTPPFPSNTYLSCPTFFLFSNIATNAVFVEIFFLAAGFLEMWPKSLETGVGVGNVYVFWGARGMRKGKGEGGGGRERGRGRGGEGKGNR